MVTQYQADEMAGYSGVRLAERTLSALGMPMPDRRTEVKGGL